MKEYAQHRSGSSYFLGLIVIICIHRIAANADAGFVVISGYTAP
jgi:hypothetical protein